MADKAIEKSNTLALFNLIRIIEDWLISKSFIFSLLLLPLDITLLAAVLVSRAERIFSQKIISGFLHYLHYDLTILREITHMVVRKEYVSQELTKNHTEGETKIEGKAFKHTQYIFRFIWSFIVFLLTFPLLPLLWLWDFLAPKVLVGWLYYLILFNELNVFLEIFLFSIATFLVATITVPWIFSLYVYIQSFFSLEKKSYHEIRKEADTFFIKLYRYNFDDHHHEEEEEKEQHGGVYYLLLKCLHSAKDHSLGILRSISKKRTTAELLNKLKLGKIRDELLSDLEKKQPISTKDLLVPLFAFAVTIIAAVVMVYAGVKGEGIIGSLMVSILDAKEATHIWFAYQGNLGYIEHYLILSPILSNILSFLGFITDQFFGYLFIIWHGVIPYYFDFTFWYYNAISELVTNAIS